MLSATGIMVRVLAKLKLNFGSKMRLPIKYSQATPAKRREVREEYVRRQKGLCYYCKEPLSGKPAKHIRTLPLERGAFPRGFWKYPVHLHHDHNTDLTLGAVHNYCNAVLWQYHGE